MNDKRKYIPWIFIPCILAFVLQVGASLFVIQAIVAYVLATFKGSTYEELVNALVDAMLSDGANVLYIIYAVAGIIIFTFVQKKIFSDDKQTKLSEVSKNVPATIAGVLLFCLGMQYVSNYLTAALASAFPAWLEEYEELMETAGLDDSLTVIMGIYAVILAPICEELIFRGVTFSAAKKVMPYYLAIVVQAILFGAFHMNAIQGCYAFVLGLGMGYVMHLYNNIFVTIIIHMIFNLIGTYGSDFLPYGGDTVIGFFLWMLGSLVVTYVSIILLRKGASSVKENEFTADI